MIIEKFFSRLVKIYCANHYECQHIINYNQITFVSISPSPAGVNKHGSFVNEFFVNSELKKCGK